MDSIDIDYADQLTPAQKKWLNQFMEEYNNASFKKGKRHLHNSKKAKSICYGINNRRNKDEYARAKARHLLDFNVNIEDVNEQSITNPHEYEDSLIDVLDQMKKAK